jgi:hypothetical protein
MSIELTIHAQKLPSFYDSMSESDLGKTFFGGQFRVIIKIGVFKGNIQQPKRMLRLLLPERENNHIFCLFFLKSIIKTLDIKYTKKIRKPWKERKR